MDAHGIDVFDEADCYFLPFAIPHNLEFELFPTFERFFYESLANRTCREGAACHCLEFFRVEHNPRPCSAYGVGWPDHAGEIDSFENAFSFFEVSDDFTPGCFNSQPCHHVFKSLPVLTAFNGIGLHADDLNAVFLQNSGLRKLGRDIQRDLSPQIREQRIRAFCGDDFFN